MDRFSDYMVKDEKTGECFRLDHLIKAHLERLGADKKAAADAQARYTSIATKVLESPSASCLCPGHHRLPVTCVSVLQLDGMSMEEMRQILREFDMRSPTTGNPVSDPMEFNLMFQTEIGPTGTLKG